MDFKRLSGYAASSDRVVPSWNRFWVSFFWQRVCGLMIALRFFVDFAQTPLNQILGATVDFNGFWELSQNRILDGTVDF